MSVYKYKAFYAKPNFQCLLSRYKNTLKYQRFNADQTLTNVNITVLFQVKKKSLNLWHCTVLGWGYICVESFTEENVQISLSLRVFFSFYTTDKWDCIQLNPYKRVLFQMNDFDVNYKNIPI